jgi:hypothetical protein
MGVRSTIGRILRAFKRRSIEMPVGSYGSHDDLLRSALRSGRKDWLPLYFQHRIARAFSA